MQVVKYELNGRVFSIQPWSVSKAMVNMQRVGSIIGPGIQDIIMGIGNTPEGQLVNLSTAVSSVLRNSDPEQTTDLIIEFVCSCAIDGKTVDPHLFDMHFKDMNEVYSVFLEVLKVNYKSFFSGLLGDKVDLLKEQ